MKKSLVVVVLASLTAFGCSSKENEIVVQNESSCLDSVDVASSPTVFAEDFVDGRPGTFRLVESRVFAAVEAEYSYADRSYIAGSTVISKNADPNRFNISSQGSVRCHATKTSYKDVSAQASMPIAISRETGRAPEELKYLVRTEYIRYAESKDKVKVESTSTSTSRHYDSGPLLNGASLDTKQTVHRLSDGRFAVRNETLEKKNRLVFIGIYELAN